MTSALYYRSTLHEFRVKVNLSSSSRLQPLCEFSCCSWRLRGRAVLDEEDMDFLVDLDMSLGDAKVGKERARTFQFAHCSSILEVGSKFVHKCAYRLYAS